MKHRRNYASASITGGCRPELSTRLCDLANETSKRGRTCRIRDYGAVVATNHTQETSFLPFSCMRKKERKKRRNSRLDHREKSKRRGIIETSTESAWQKRRWEKNDEKCKEKRTKGYEFSRNDAFVLLARHRNRKYYTAGK